MKKFLLIAGAALALLGVLNGCASSKALEYPEPVFDKPQGGVIGIIDAFQASGEYEDYVKLHTNSTDININFNIYVHDPASGQWLFYGAGTLKGAGDTDTISSSMGTIAKFRYFAVESLNGKSYQYQAYTNRNDLHITILD